ncbi:MAG: hypothetical protein GXN92_01415 [Candidatus Micrarchaeota archaeon]|nr:hypothetical protein [Candidatus Micrarchaeota archaeon]
MKEVIEKIKKGEVQPQDIASLPDEDKYLILGALAIKNKQYQKAIDFLEKVRHRDMARRLLGYAWFARGRFFEANAWLESVKKKTPSDYMLLAFSNLILGDEKKAQQYLRTALALDKPKAINMLRSFIMNAKESKKVNAIKKLLAMLER